MRLWGGGGGGGGGGGEFYQSLLYSTPSAIERLVANTALTFATFDDSLKSDPSNSLSYENSLNKENISVFLLDLDRVRLFGFGQGNPPLSQ